MGDVEGRMHSIEQATSQIATMSQEISEVNAAVRVPQEEHAALEPCIDEQIAVAMQTSTAELSKQLDGKFDTLGQQLLQQIASMARKRDSDSRGDDMGRNNSGAQVVLQAVSEGNACRSLKLGIGSLGPSLSQPTVSQAREKMCCIVLSSCPKGRRLWRMYRPAKSSVRDRFALQSDQGAFLDIDEVQTLDSEAIYRVISEEWSWQDALLLQGMDVQAHPPKDTSSRPAASSRDPMPALPAPSVA